MSTNSSETLRSIVLGPDVLFVEQNRNYRVPSSSEGREALVANIFDNPPIPLTIDRSARVVGHDDPLSKNQWGMIDIGASSAWEHAAGKGVVVAIIDSGVDYTHEDLAQNIWRNPGESGMDSNGRDKSSNNLDDDGNGLVDDVIGWDFRDEDNKPYDAVSKGMGPALGFNAGHGTHCAGTIAAARGNGVGIAGVAPEAEIMPLRFLNAKGEGNDDGAISAINYAVAKGAKIISSSWGSEGDANDPNTSIALRESIKNAEAHGVLFITSAGNGRPPLTPNAGVGFDNDGDSQANIPSSFSYSNIISVTAIDQDNALPGFANWGANTVHLAAPGVQIFSTMPGGRYSDMSYKGIWIEYWQGTSMASPFVAGAAAAYWSDHPSASYLDVKNALLSSVVPLPSLAGKVMSGGKLNVKNLMSR